MIVTGDYDETMLKEWNKNRRFKYQCNQLLKLCEKNYVLDAEIFVHHPEYELFGQIDLIVSNFQSLSYNSIGTDLHTFYNGSKTPRESTVSPQNQVI